MSTRAIKYLKQKDITFEVIKYEHEEKGAEFVAKAIGFPVEKTIKTLLLNWVERNTVSRLCRELSSWI